MTKFIAEISSNHNNDKKRIKKLISQCSEAGFYAVKFQAFKIDKLFHDSILKRSKAHLNRKKWELNNKFLNFISAECIKKNIKLGFTPFDYDSLNLIYKQSDFIKVSSYDLLRHNFINNVLNKKKLTLISTGMSSLRELRSLKKLLDKNSNKNIAILHCVSRYPCQTEMANLNFIKKIKKMFNSKVGWSDHTNNLLILYEAALTLSSDFIEVHVDLEDKKGFEGNVGHCYNIYDVKNLISFIKNRKKILGSSDKKNYSYEINESNWRADPSDGLRPLLKIR